MGEATQVLVEDGHALMPRQIVQRRHEQLAELPLIDTILRRARGNPRLRVGRLRIAGFALSKDVDAAIDRDSIEPWLCRKG
jgi:hypothetical protein